MYNEQYITTIEIVIITIQLDSIAILLDNTQHYGASLTEHCTCRSCGVNKQQVTATKDGSTHNV